MRTLFACLLALTLATPALAEGNVTTELDAGGVLRIVGDELPNGLDIVPGDVEGEVAVIGIDGTTVDGLARVDFPGVRTLNVRMGSGNDDVLVAGLVLRRDLRVRMEGGHDDFVVEDTVVRRRVTFDGGDGRDRFTARGGCVFRRSVKVTGRHGQDELVLRNTRVLGRVRLVGGAANDSIVIDGCAFNRFASVVVLAGDGADDVRVLHSVFFLNVDVRAGNGPDDVYIHATDFNEDLDLELGRQDDDVELHDVDFDEDVEIDGGSGHDVLDLDGRIDFPSGRDAHEVRLRDFEHRH